MRKKDSFPARPKLDLFHLDLRFQGLNRSAHLFRFFIPTQLIKIGEKPIMRKIIANAKEIEK